MTFDYIAKISLVMPSTTSVQFTKADPSVGTVLPLLLPCESCDITADRHLPLLPPPSPAPSLLYRASSPVRLSSGQKQAHSAR